MTRYTIKASRKEPVWPDECEHGLDYYVATLWVASTEPAVVDVYMFPEKLCKHYGKSDEWGPVRLCIRYGAHDKYMSYELNRFMSLCEDHHEKQLNCVGSNTPIQHAVREYLLGWGHLSWTPTKLPAYYCNS